MSLIPGVSTVAEAAEFYRCGTELINYILRSALTDVYTPDGDATVVQYLDGPSDLVLGRDSIKVLDIDFRYEITEGSL